LPIVFQFKPDEKQGDPAPCALEVADDAEQRRDRFASPLIFAARRQVRGLKTGYQPIVLLLPTHRRLRAHHGVDVKRLQRGRRGGANITRSQGERDAFREIFNSTGTVNPSLASIKAAFADIFSGTGGAVNRTHITAMSKRKANRLEKIFATGTGTLASPGTLVVEGDVDEFTIRVLAWSDAGEWLL